MSERGEQGREQKGEKRGWGQGRQGRCGVGVGEGVGM